VKEHIYSQVAAQRRYLGLSQGELASLAGVSREKVNRVENQREDMSFELLCRLADAVGLRVMVVPKGSEVVVDGKNVSSSPAELKNHALPALPLEQARIIDGSRAKVLSWGSK
jgi:predicted transcriptional regulator